MLAWSKREVHRDAASASSEGKDYEFCRHGRGGGSEAPALNQNLGQMKRHVNFRVGFRVSTLKPTDIEAGRDCHGKEIKRRGSSDQSQEAKPVIYLREHPKGIIINVTNAKAIANDLGEDETEWTGRAAGSHAHRDADPEIRRTGRRDPHEGGTKEEGAAYRDRRSKTIMKN